MTVNSFETYQKKILIIWGDVLDISKYKNGETTLFDLNCDSIKAVAIQGMLEKEFKCQLPFNFLYQYTSLNKQISFLRSYDYDIIKPKNEVEIILLTIASDVSMKSEGEISFDININKLFSNLDFFFNEVARVFEIANMETDDIKFKNLSQLGDELHKVLKIGNTDKNQKIPLMNFQETLYFHSKGFVKNEPSNLSCFILISLDIDGLLDVEILGKAFNKIINSHDILRSYITDEDSKPYMVVSDAMHEMAIADYDISHMNPKEQEIFLTEELREFNDIRFDCSKIGMYECKVYKKSELTSTLAFHIDHFLVDGYSFMQLLTEVFKCYESYQQNKEFEIVQTYMKFKDYACLEKFRQNTKTYKKHLADRLKIFGKIPNKPLLPTLKDPANIDTVTFDTYYQYPKKEIIASLATIAGNNLVTLNSILMASFFKLVQSYTSQDRAIINMPIFNREHYFPEASNVMGTFIDIFPVLLESSIDEPIVKMAIKIENFVRSMLKVPVSSIELVREIVKKNKEISGGLSPLIFSNSIGVWQNSKSFDDDNLSINNPLFRTGAPGTHIDFVLYDYKDQYYFNWNYVRDLFSADYVETFADQYMLILEDTVKCCTKNFNTGILLQKKHLDIYKSINQTQSPYPIECIHKSFEKAVFDFPDAIALSTPEEKITYKALNERSIKLAKYLVQNGVQKGSFVALLFNRSIDMVIAQISVLKAGGAYVPIDPSYPDARIDYVIQDSGTSLLLTHSDINIPDIVKNSLKNKIVLCDAINAVDIGLPEVSANDKAYMIYTSGSTGNPKGVMIRHCNIRNFLYWVEKYYDIFENDNFAFVTSYAFDMTLASNWVPLFNGATLHILDDKRTKDPVILLKYIEKSKITLLNVTPSHFSLLASARDTLSELHDLKMTPKMRIMLGGEVINKNDLNIWLKYYPDTIFVNEYGPTEASVASSFFPISTKDGRVNDVIIPIGKPLNNNTFYIVDKQNNLCMPNVAGELCIGGAGVAIGYYNKDSKTKEVFVKDPFESIFFETDENRLMYKTGDMARILLDGNIEFLGRNDHQINLRGYRIEAGEIEDVLIKHPNISQVAIKTIKDENNMQSLVSFYTTHNLFDIYIGELTEFVEKSLPQYMIPSYFEYLEEMPITASNKLDYAKLPDTVTLDNKDVNQKYLPSTSIQKEIAIVWEKIIGFSIKNIHSSFWDIGGDSLKAMSLVVEYRKIGFKDIGLGDLFEYTTISQMEKLFTNGKNYNQLQLLHLKKTDSNKSIFLIPYACGGAGSFNNVIKQYTGNSNIYALNPSLIDDTNFLTIQDLGTLLANEINSTKYEEIVILGYSYGGYVAYDALSKISIQKQDTIKLVIIGTTPPNSHNELSFVVKSDKNKLIQYTQNIYGDDIKKISSDDADKYIKLLIKQSKDMLEYDFDNQFISPYKTYIVTAKNEEDKEIKENYKDWENYISNIEYKTIKGKHMFIRDNPKLISMILDDIEGDVMKNIYIIGSTGTVGRELVALINDYFEHAFQINIIKLSSNKSLVDNNCSYLYFNVNIEETYSIIKPSNIIVNCAGPSYKYSKIISNIAIERECYYIDVGGYDPLFDFLKTKKISRPFIINAGLLPGYSGIFAKKNFSSFDTIETMEQKIVATDKWSTGSAIDIIHSIGDFNKKRLSCEYKNKVITKIPFSEQTSFFKPIKKNKKIFSFYSTELERIATKFNIKHTRSYGVNNHLLSNTILLLCFIFKGYKTPKKIYGWAKKLVWASSFVKKEDTFFSIKTTISGYKKSQYIKISEEAYINNTYKATAGILYLSIKKMLENELKSGVYGCAEILSCSDSEYFLEKIACYRRKKNEK